MKPTNFKKYLFSILICIICFFSYSNSNIVYADGHTHNDNCYSVIRHEHGSACYYDANAGGCGTDTIEWKAISTQTANCINCDGTYEYTYYKGTCSGCKKEYTDTIYGTCSKCGNIMRPLKEGNSIYPKYPSTKCTYQIQGESLMLLSCDKETDGYYNSDGSLAMPECNKVAVSISALKQLQSGKEVDTTIEVTFLDGHKENVQGTSNFNPNKSYNNSDVIIYYEGIVFKAGNKGTLSTIIKMTTPYNLATQTPTIPPTIIVTEVPPQNTFVPTQHPTKVPTTNTNNGGNRLETNNSNSNTNSNSNSSNKGNSSGNKFSGNNTTRGEAVANKNNNSNNTTTMTITPTITYKPREAIKIKITRPLTEEEKQEKIDGSMVLTKLYRNEENDVIGVQKKKEDTSNPTNTNSLITGTVNKGNSQETKGKIMIFVFFFAIFVVITGIGGYMFIKKKREEDQEFSNQIDLQNSIRY